MLDLVDDSLLSVLVDQCTGHSGHRAGVCHMPVAVHRGRGF